MNLQRLSRIHGICYKKKRKILEQSASVVLIIAVIFFQQLSIFSSIYIPKAEAEENIADEAQAQNLQPEEKSLPSEEKKDLSDEKKAGEDVSQKSQESIEENTDQQKSDDQIVNNSSQKTDENSSSTVDFQNIETEKKLNTSEPEIKNENVSSNLEIDTKPEENDFTWNFTDGKFETSEDVSIGIEYVAPQNESVKVEFTKLPENPGKLSIKEIHLTKEQQEASGALSDVAYDIASDMEDGTFAYNLTLPIPKNSSGEEKVKFSESISEIDSSKFVLEKTTKDFDSIKIYDLNHFTIFYIVNAVPPASGTINTLPFVVQQHGSVNVPLYLNLTPGMNISGFTVDISFDSTIVTIAADSDISPGNFNGSISKIANYSTNGNIQTARISGSTSSLTQSSGTITLANINFTAAAAAEPGSSTDIQITPVELLDTSTPPIALPLPASTLSNVTVSMADFYPTLGFVSINSNNQNPPISSVDANGNTTIEYTATVGDTVTILFTSLQPLQTPIVTIDGKLALVTGSGISWAASHVMSSEDQPGIVTFTIEYTNTNQVPGSLETSTYDGTFVNFSIPVLPPVVGAILPQRVIAGNQLSFPVVASTPNADGNIAYSLMGAPAGAVIDSNGIFSWTPALTAVGNYNFNISVTDGIYQGSVSIPLNITVDPAPVIDTIAPNIEIIGDAYKTIIQGSNYIDEGARAFDNVDGDITAKIITVNKVDTSTIGTYTVTYDVSDSKGNQAKTAVRTVNVIADPKTSGTPPIDAGVQPPGNNSHHHKHHHHKHHHNNDNHKHSEKKENNEILSVSYLPNAAIDENVNNQNDIEIQNNPDQGESKIPALENDANINKEILSQAKNSEKSSSLVLWTISGFTLSVLTWLGRKYLISKI